LPFITRAALHPHKINTVKSNMDIDLFIIDSPHKKY
jgi:hypothetical protein